MRLELFSKVGDGLISGGAFDPFFAVPELDALDDLGEAVRSVEAAPFFGGRLA